MAGTVLHTVRRWLAPALGLVAACALSACNGDPNADAARVGAPSPKPGACTFIGINAGAPVWGGNTVIDVEALRKTGAGSVRLDFLVDDRPNFDDVALARYDAIIDGLQAQGLAVLGTINYGALHEQQADWNDDPDGDGMNDYVVEFAAVARLLMDRYGDRIKVWEIWNEPDCWENDDWASNPQQAGCTYVLPRVYSKLLAETYVQAKDVISTRSLVLASAGLFGHDLGGSRTTGAGYMTEVYENGVWDWFEAQHGRRYPWSLFGYHLYVDQDLESDGKKLASYLDEMKELATSHGDTAPFLITEIGWQADPASESELERQRKNMATSFEVLSARSDVVGAFWFTFRDFPGKWWGIDGKPALGEFAAQTDACGSTAPPVDETACEHSECAEGAALGTSCSPCTNAVCAKRPSCCTGSWDAECVALAADTPGPCRAVCADGQSSCSHDECVMGDVLEASCSSCAASVCERDPFCCSHTWDYWCTAEAKRDPFCLCQ